MEITELSIRILLLFLPGFICSYLIDTFTTHKERTPFFFSIQSILYGFLSYIFLDFLYIPFGKQLHFFAALLNTNVQISSTEIIHVCFFAFFFSLAYAFILEQKIHFRLAHKLNITKKFGEKDVWSFAFNSKEIGNWVTIRDHDLDLMYQGWVNAFSDTSKESEILLRDVSVYKNNNGDRLYQIGCMYLSRSRDKITIEFANIELDERIKWKE